MKEELSLSRAEIDALANDIAETAAHIDAATHRLLTLIREFDRAGGWHQQGALSCAHWLSWRIGLGLGPAREKVRVAHRLAELPRIDEALRRGERSYSKVRAMTRVASAENEADLLDMARHSTASQLERICRLCRQVRSLAGEDPRAVEDERRWVETRATDDGMVSIQIRLHPDEAGRVIRALELCADGGSLADGAVALAESALVGSVQPGGAVRPPVEMVVMSPPTRWKDGPRPAMDFPRKRAAAFSATPGWCRCRKTRPVRRSMSGARPGPSPPRSGALQSRDRGCRFPG